MKKKIITDPKVLRQKCRPVKEEMEVAIIIQDLIDTFEGMNGYGLAANQIGIDKQVGYIKVGEKEIKLINPIITSKNGRTIFPNEACFSFPGLKVNTDRYKEVILKVVWEQIDSNILLRALKPFASNTKLITSWVSHSYKGNIANVDNWSWYHGGTYRTKRLAW